MNKVILNQNSPGLSKISNLVTVDMKDIGSNVLSSLGSGESMLVLSGGHGSLKDDLYNGVSKSDLSGWCQKNSSAKFDLIVLDVCDSSALVSTFTPLLKSGGELLCSHGTGQGMREAVINTDKVSDAKAALANVVKTAVNDFAVGSSVAVYDGTNYHRMDDAHLNDEDSSSLLASITADLTKTQGITNITTHSSASSLTSHI